MKQNIREIDKIEIKFEEYISPEESRKNVKERIAKWWKNEELKKVKAKFLK